MEDPDVSRLTAATSRGTLKHGGCFMTNEFTAVIEREGEWFIGYSP